MPKRMTLLFLARSDSSGAGLDTLRSGGGDCGSGIMKLKSISFWLFFLLPATAGPPVAPPAAAEEAATCQLPWEGSYVGRIEGGSGVQIRVNLLCKSERELVASVAGSSEGSRE